MNIKSLNSQNKENVYKQLISKLNSTYVDPKMKKFKSKLEYYKANYIYEQII